MHTSHSFKIAPPLFQILATRLKGVQHNFEISLLPFIHKIFEQNFYLYTTIYLVRIWAYKNAGEKAHTFSRRSKKVKKRTKMDKKRILSKIHLNSDAIAAKLKTK